MSAPIDLQRGVLKALGLERRQHITSLVISFEGGKLPTVNVTTIVGINKEDGELIEALAQYVLVPRDEVDLLEEAGRPA